MSAAGFEPLRVLWWLVFLQLPEANQHTVALGFLRLPCAWLVLALCLPCACLDPLWGAGETVILSQSAVNSLQSGHAASEAQEKPSVSFI